MTHPFRNPLRYDGEPMPAEAFRDLRHVPGYKYEYFDGKASISVQLSACPTVASTPTRLLDHLDEHHLGNKFAVGPASKASVADVETLWGQAFLQTPDYYGFSLEDIQDDARDTLNDLYNDTPSALHPASAVVRRNGTLLGALLITTKKARPCIEILFLRRNERRRSLASAMLRRAAGHLNEEDSNVLCSGFLLANAGSAAWHHSVGFAELPDWLSQNHRYRCLQHNVQRGLVRDLFSARRHARALREQVESMREERRDDPTAHVPFRWLKTDGERIDNALQRRLDEVDDAGAGAPGRPL